MAVTVKTTVIVDAPKDVETTVIIKMKPKASAIKKIIKAN